MLKDLINDHYFVKLVITMNSVGKIRQHLKEWGLLKTRDDYLFFQRITKMLSLQKIQEFKADFLRDLEILTDIVKLGKIEDAKIYIDTLNDRKRRIVAADTYFTMFYTYS